jgi:hypothetical protein
LGSASLIVYPLVVGGLGGLQMETATRDLITVMKRARSNAISQQKTFRTILSNSPDPNGISKYILADEYQKPIKNFDLPKGVVFSRDEIGKEDQVISFYSNGRSSGGTFELKNSKGKIIKINVDPITGFGKMVKKDKGGLR